MLTRPTQYAIINDRCIFITIKRNLGKYTMYVKFGGTLYWPCDFKFYYSIDIGIRGNC